MRTPQWHPQSSPSNGGPCVRCARCATISKPWCGKWCARVTSWVKWPGYCVLFPHKFIWCFWGFFSPMEASRTIVYWSIKLSRIVWLVLIPPWWSNKFETKKSRQRPRFFPLHCCAWDHHSPLAKRNAQVSCKRVSWLAGHGFLTFEVFLYQEKTSKF